MNILSAALFLIAKDTIIMFCHIRQQDDAHPQKILSLKDWNILRTKWGNTIKKKIHMHKQTKQ